MAKLEKLERLALRFRRGQRVDICSDLVALAEHTVGHVTQLKPSRRYNARAVGQRTRLKRQTGPLRACFVTSTLSGRWKRSSSHRRTHRQLGVHAVSKAITIVGVKCRERASLSRRVWVNDDVQVENVVKVMCRAEIDLERARPGVSRSRRMSCLRVGEVPPRCPLAPRWTARRELVPGSLIVELLGVQ